MRIKRIAVIDDEPIFALALRARLEAEPDFVVVATVSSAREALTAVMQTRPDVALFDVSLGDADGIELQRRLLERCPWLRTLMLTGLAEPRRVLEAMRSGASGWVVKDARSEELVEAVRRVSQGECWISPRILHRILDELMRPSEEGRLGPLAVLSDREAEVLQLLVDGQRRPDIASALCLSPNTVRTHVQNVLGKLHVHSVLEAVAVGLRFGMRPAAVEGAASSRVDASG